jgi:hypothetical protein
MKHQQMEGVSAETASRPEAQRTAPHRRQLLLLTAVALAGAVLGVVGMYYVGTRDGAMQTIDHLLGNQGATRTRAAPEARPDEASREGGHRRRR